MFSVDCTDRALQVLQQILPTATHVCTHQQPDGPNHICVPSTDGCGRHGKRRGAAPQQHAAATLSAARDQSTPLADSAPSKMLRSAVARFKTTQQQQARVEQQTIPACMCHARPTCLAAVQPLTMNPSNHSTPSTLEAPANNRSLQAATTEAKCCIQLLSAHSPSN